MYIHYWRSLFPKEDNKLNIRFSYYNRITTDCSWMIPGSFKQMIEADEGNSR